MFRNLIWFILNLLPSVLCVGCASMSVVNMWAGRRSRSASEAFWGFLCDCFLFKNVQQSYTIPCLEKEKRTMETEETEEMERVGVIRRNVLPLVHKTDG